VRFHRPESSPAPIREVTAATPNTHGVGSGEYNGGLVRRARGHEPPPLNRFEAVLIRPGGPRARGFFPGGLEADSAGVRRFAHGLGRLVLWPGLQRRARPASCSGDVSNERGPGRKPVTKRYGPFDPPSVY